MQALALMWLKSLHSTARAIRQKAAPLCLSHPTHAPLLISISTKTASVWLQTVLSSQIHQAQAPLFGSTRTNGITAMALLPTIRMYSENNMQAPEHTL